MIVFKKVLTYNRICWDYNINCYYNSQLSDIISDNTETVVILGVYAVAFVKFACTK